MVLYYCLDVLKCFVPVTGHGSLVKKRLKRYQVLQMLLASGQFSENQSPDLWGKAEGAKDPE